MVKQELFDLDTRVIVDMNQDFALLFSRAMKVFLMTYGDYEEVFPQLYN